MTQKEKAIYFFKTILQKVNPQQLLPEVISWDPLTGSLSIYDRIFYIKDHQKIYIIGTGKASATMASAVEQILGDRIKEGMVIAPPGAVAELKRIRLLKGSHPLPDSKSASSSVELLSFIEKIPENAVVINLVSGGTSSLFCVPAEGLKIEDIRTVYRLLIQSGATIHEINTVRKTLSRVKGGQLLEYVNHTTLIDLIISDVPDDDIRAIGSGPSAAQEISIREAVQLSKRYGFWDHLPDSVRDHLELQQRRESDDGISFNTTDFKNHHSWIIASASMLAKETAQLIQQDGYEVIPASSPWSGPIEDFEDHIITAIHAHAQSKTGPTALVFFGECTVHVKGDGLGGRNQELALRMAKRLDKTDLEGEIIFLSAGTDGIDGPTDAAGAVVDTTTWSRAQKQGLDPEKHLAQNNSYRFFQKAGGHIITGPTGNNLMDLQIVLC